MTIGWKNHWMNNPPMCFSELSIPNRYFERKSCLFIWIKSKQQQLTESKCSPMPGYRIWILWTSFSFIWENILSDGWTVNSSLMTVIHLVLFCCCFFSPKYARGVVLSFRYYSKQYEFSNNCMSLDLSPKFKPFIVLSSRFLKIFW